MRNHNQLQPGAHRLNHLPNLRSRNNHPQSMAPQRQHPDLLRLQSQVPRRHDRLLVPLTLNPLGLVLSNQQHHLQHRNPFHLHHNKSQLPHHLKKSLLYPNKRLPVHLLEVKISLKNPLKQFMTPSRQLNLPNQKSNFLNLHYRIFRL